MIPTSFNPMGRNVGGGRLPIGWIELEYLESVGCRQYIDTGVVPQADCIIEADAMFVNPEALSTVYWCREWHNTPVLSYPSFACISAAKPTGNMSLRVYHAMTGAAEAGTYPVQLLGGERFTFKSKYNAFYVNGQQTSLPAQVQYTPVTTIGLFWLREDGHWIQDSQPATSSSVRIYRFKVTSGNGRLECNFIPALDPTGRPCMFDLVTRRPFYNQGTGEFLWGGEPGVTLPDVYSRAYSVYFDGDTYVNTGITPSVAPLYRTDMTAVVNTSRTSLIGAYGSSPFTFIGLRADRIIYAGKGGSYGGSVSYSEKRCIWEFAADGVYVDGTKVFDGGKLTDTHQWVIMGCPWGGSYNEMKGTFYSLTLRNSANELVAQYIPVHNSETDEYLLWETVSGTPVTATKGQILGYRP